MTCLFWAPDYQDSRGASLFQFTLSILRTTVLPPLFSEEHRTQQWSGNLRAEPRSGTGRGQQRRWTPAPPHTSQHSYPSTFTLSTHFLTQG